MQSIRAVLLCPIRFALFEKGGDAFVCVAPEHVFDHHGAGMGVGLIKGQAELVVKGAFADMDGCGEFGGEGLGKALGFIPQLVRRGNAVDKSHIAGAGGGKEFACCQHLERHSRGNLAGESDHWGGAEQANIHAVDAKARIFGRYDHVARGGELAAGGGGDAVDLRDHRLGQGGDALHQGGATGEKIGEGGGAFVGKGAGGLHFAQVVARAESATCAAQDDHADGPICGEAVQFGRKRGDHGIGQGVERGGPIQGDGGDRAVIFALDQVFGHCIPLWLWASIRGGIGRGKRWN